MKNTFRTLCRSSAALFAVLLAVSGLAGGTQASAREYVPDPTPVQVSGNYSYKLYTGGTLEIVPREEGGTRVTVFIPWEQE